jgi:polyhydroxyalkanoate synthesis regulator phasin
VQIRKLCERRRKMKKPNYKALFISLAMMLALTLVLAGCSASGETAQALSESLAVGVMTASTNSSSDIETQAQAAARHQALMDGAIAIYQESTGVAIDPEQFKDALAQAQTAQKEEALETHMQNLVDEGRINQQEADQYLEWWQSRPEGLPGLAEPRLGGRMGGRSVPPADDGARATEDQPAPVDRHQELLDRACAIYQENTGVAIDSEQLRDAFHRALSELREEALETHVQNLVDEGRITQEEADSYLEWWQSRPEIDAPLPGLGGPGPGGGMMRGGLGPHGDPRPGPDTSGEAAS